MKKLFSVLAVLLIVAVLITSCDPNGNSGSKPETIPEGFWGSWTNDSGYQNIRITEDLFIWGNVDMWTLSDWVSGNIRYTVSDTVVRIDFEHAELGWGSPISGFYEFTLSEDGKSLTFHEKWTADNPEDATEYTEYDKTVVYVN